MRNLNIVPLLIVRKKVFIANRRDNACHGGEPGGRCGSQAPQPISHRLEWSDKNESPAPRQQGAQHPEQS